MPRDCRIATPSGWLGHYAFACFGHGSFLQRDCQHGLLARFAPSRSSMGCWAESCRFHHLEMLVPYNSQTASRPVPDALNGLRLHLLALLMLLHLTPLHRDATTTVLALFPFLRLTFSLHCVLGRLRKMAMLLLVRRYMHNVKSQSASCKAGCCINRYCKIRPRPAVVAVAEWQLKERRGFLPPSSSSRCGILSRNTEFSLGKIKQVHVTELTMAMNRMLQDSLPAATRHALSISPGICRMCCPHTENVLSIYNVSSLDRTCSLCSDAQGVEHVARQTRLARLK